MTVFLHVPFPNKIPRRNKQFCSWFRSSILLSYEATEKVFRRTPTQARIYQGFGFVL
jgi:hypothetical protein